MYGSDEILKTIIDGCRSNKTILEGLRIGKYRNWIYSIGPHEPLETAMKKVGSMTIVTEMLTSKNFYRLGGEFHSRDSLTMLAEISPLEETRIEAREILQTL